MPQIIDLQGLLDRCKNKRFNEKDITLDTADIEVVIHRLQKAEADIAEAVQQLELSQRECHSIRRAYLHEKSMKEKESDLAHMLLKALEIADHDEGTGGGQMAKQWMLQAVAEAVDSPVMLLQTFAFDKRYDDDATRNLRMILDRHRVEAKR